MPIESKHVTDRRQIKYNSLDEMLGDAQRLVDSPTTRTLGNWPLGALLAHLAVAVNGSIDGVPFKAPLIARVVGPFLKRRILTNGVTPGFNLPKGTESGAFPLVDSQQGLAELRKAVARTERERMAAPHPVFGKMTHDEWTTLHLHHSAMHLSFAVPE